MHLKLSTVLQAKPGDEDATSCIKRNSGTDTKCQGFIYGLCVETSNKALPALRKDLRYVCLENVAVAFVQYVLQGQLP